jgi:hypothetical protein
VAWCSWGRAPRFTGVGRIGQLAIAGRLTAAHRSAVRWFPASCSGALAGPFIVLFEEDRSHKTDDGVLVGEDADDISESLDLTVEALDRVGGVQLGTVLVM